MPGRRWRGSHKPEIGGFRDIADMLVFLIGRCWVIIVSARYQTQMKASQASNSEVLKEVAMLREEANMLKERNGELNKQVDMQQREMIVEKESILREKEIMVAQLEMLDDSLDSDPNENDLQPNLAENDKTGNLEKKLNNVQSALDQERDKADALAIRKEELENRNLELKQGFVNEQMKTLKVAQDLEDAKEKVRQLKEELQRTFQTRQETEFETLKMKSDLQVLEQKNTLFQNQLASLQNDMSK